MNDISELEQRLAAALDRIGAGLGGLGRAGVTELAEPSTDPEAPSPEVESLRAQLEAEREVTAQLEERVRAVREKQDERVAELEAQLADLEAKLAPLQADRQRLKKVNQQLRNNNVALRSANAEGLADPELVNRSMKAELEALRTVQASDSEELEAILADLAPILKEAEAQDA